MEETLGIDGLSYFGEVGEDNVYSKDANSEFQDFW